MKTVFVGCSSSDNIKDERILAEAQTVAGLLGKEDFNLVFGACNHGLMGIVYRTMLSYGSKVIGVAPELYKEDFKELNCFEEYVTKTVDERTFILIDKSDFLLFLPGGTGTLEELMTAIEMKRRKEINKKIIIYDINGFYIPFIEQLESMENFGFSIKLKDLFEYINNKEELEEEIKKLKLERL